MKFDRIGINEIDIEMTDEEAKELSFLIDVALDHLEEYSDLKLLRAHNKTFYKLVIASLQELANYK